jgi:hypothetical protein
MLHVLRMALALVTADTTRVGARLNNDPRDCRLKSNLPTDDIPGCCTDIGAVEVQPDAPREHLDILLAEARVRAGDACLRAVVTGVDAAAEKAAIDDWLRWMRIDHLLCVGHALPPASNS